MMHEIKTTGLWYKIHKLFVTKQYYELLRTKQVNG